jgi:hypothetical protein
MVSPSDEDAAGYMAPPDFRAPGGWRCRSRLDAAIDAVI